MPLRYRWFRRLVQLQAGLVLFGVSMAMFIRADLGLDPWDVFHQGVSERTAAALSTPRWPSRCGGC